jgi:hypothetical protein
MDTGLFFSFLFLQLTSIFEFEKLHESRLYSACIYVRLTILFFRRQALGQSLVYKILGEHLVEGGLSAGDQIGIRIGCQEGENKAFCQLY